MKVATSCCTVCKYGAAKGLWCLGWSVVIMELFCKLCEWLTSVGYESVFLTSDLGKLMKTL
jgi:hypothetical protein